MSSAKSRISLLTLSTVSLIIKKSVGPSTEPWGTPEVTLQAGDLAPSTATYWERPWRNELN